MPLFRMFMNDEKTLKRLLATANKVPAYAKKNVLTADKKDAALYFLNSYKKTICEACETESPSEKRPTLDRCPHCGVKVTVKGIIKDTTWRTLKNSYEDAFYLKAFGDGIILVGAHIWYKLELKDGHLVKTKEAFPYHVIWNDGERLRSYSLRTGELKKKATRTDYQGTVVLPKYILGMMSNWDWKYGCYYREAERTLRRHRNPMFSKCPYIQDGLIAIQYTKTVEMLYRQGFKRLSKNLMKCGKINEVNLKAKCKEDFFGLSSNEISWLRKMDVGLQELGQYKKLKQKAPHCVPSPFVMKVMSTFGVERQNERFKTLYPDYRDLRDVVKVCQRYGIEETFALYADYLEAAQTLGWDLRRHPIRFPKNLREAHDDAIKMAERFRQKVKDEKIATRAKALQELSFSDGFFEIVIPENVSEFRNEGETLCHCVAGYAERVAEGQTAIVFVRQSKEIQTPFVTVELDERKMEIVQARGKNNKNPPQEVSAFLKKWQAFAQKKKTGPRVRQKAGKR